MTFSPDNIGGGEKKRPPKPLGNKSPDLRAEVQLIKNKEIEEPEKPVMSKEQRKLVKQQIEEERQRIMEMKESEEGDDLSVKETKIKRPEKPVMSKEQRKLVEEQIHKEKQVIEESKKADLAKAEEESRILKGAMEKAESFPEDSESESAELLKVAKDLLHEMFEFLRGAEANPDDYRSSNVDMIKKQAKDLSGSCAIKNVRGDYLRSAIKAARRTFNEYKETAKVEEKKGLWKKLFGA